MRLRAIHTTSPGPPRTRRPLLLVAAALIAVAVAGGARAGVADYPSPLYLSGPPSAVAGHGSSYQLVGAPWPAPTTSVATGASTLAVATYRYVYTVDTGVGETASLAADAVVTGANQQVTISGLPTGSGITVRLYRMNVTTPTDCYTRVWLSAAGNAQSTFTDSSGTASCTNALRRAEDRFPLSQTGWTELSPGVTAPGPPFNANSATVASPASPNKKGWIVDGAGEVSFPAGTWTFEVQTRSVAAATDVAAAAVLVVGMWKVDASTGNAVATILAPTEQVQAPASLVGTTNTLRTMTIDATVPAFSLAAGERLYVQFWRHQTSPYVTSNGAANRVSRMYAWNGVTRIKHPGASGFATEPTPVAPAVGASVVSRQLAATFNDPDSSDTGVVDFRLCADSAAAGSECATLVDSGSSGSVATGQTATWTAGAALTDGATYHWQTRGRDALGGSSAWTATRSFTVDTAPGAPTLVGPAVGVSARAFSFHASYGDPDGHAGAIEFRVCSSEAAAGVACAGLAAGGTVTGLASGATATWTPPAPLADGTYHWQARSADDPGATSDWTATRSFRLDATAPAAPAALGATVADGTLTLRWLPPSDDVRFYVVFVDGQPVQTLGAKTFEAKLGRFDARDGRRFSVGAIDVAGNEGPRTHELVGVPGVTGLAVEDARAAVAARGLVLDEESAESSRASDGDEIVVAQTPAAPAIVSAGAAVAVVAKAREEAPLLGFTDVDVSCEPRRRLVLRIWLAERAQVTVTLVNQRARTVRSWRLGALAEGERRPTLPLPASLRPGRYRLLVAAAAARSARLSRPLTLTPRGARGRNATASACSRR